MKTVYTCPHCGAHDEHDRNGDLVSCRACHREWNQVTLEILEGLFRVGVGPEPGAPWKAVKPSPLGPIRKL